LSLKAESLIKGFRFFTFSACLVGLLATRCTPVPDAALKTELIYSLTEHFETHAQRTENGVEFWLARDLQALLGYAKWENFVKVVNKAKIAC
jgi:DNA-damage-inducible protein D